MRPRGWAVAVVVGAVFLLGLLQLQLDLARFVFPFQCQTTLCCEECREVSVSRVIDGDTFDSPVGRVRLYGVDTPEREQQCYNAARRRLSGLAGGSVRVEPGPRASDPNGRLLFYAYTRRGESIDERLVREGLARAWAGDGQHRDLLVELEQGARRAGEGCLWGP